MDLPKSHKPDNLASAMHTPFDSESLLQDIEDAFRADEDACVEQMLPLATLGKTERSKAVARATRWITAARQDHKPSRGAAELLSRFGMSSDEGVALMCLAEALLRIPDHETADELIREKLSDANWERILEQNLPFSENVAGWALALTGKVIGLAESEKNNPKALLGKLVANLGQPLIREAVKSAMNWVAEEFIAGEQMETALDKCKSRAEKGTIFSFDHLGETARSSTIATKYFDDYMKAIDNLSAFNKKHGLKRPCGLSVRLSALHPRYEYSKRERIMDELVPRLVAICEHAAMNNVPVTIDAEMTEKLFLTLEVFSALLETAQIDGWEGLGITIQSYEKRSLAVVHYLARLAHSYRRKIIIRLVKGSNWEAEIKRAQEEGWENFPVYTRKQSTDASYLACARKILEESDWLKPIFATHNAMTIAGILELTLDPSKLEFQQFYGMGEELFSLMQSEGIVCSIYTPIGKRVAILGHLARKMLEHSVSSSFIGLLHDPSISVEKLTIDPADELKDFPQAHHPFIRRAPDLFSPERKNSLGLDLSDPFVVAPLLEQIGDHSRESYSAVPIINGKKFGPADHVQQIKNPATGAVIGEALTATESHIEEAFAAAVEGFLEWNQTPADDRADCLEKLADILEENRAELMRLLIHEAGKTVPEALAEVREAADFCHYYAMRAREDFAPQTLPGPTGEHNTLQLAGRGVFICISPWNFPLSIFLGQIAAALVTGNSVVAKPAPQTPLIAAFVAQLIFDAGIPENVFSFLPGDADVGISMLQNSAVAGVAFTGSIAAARSINRMMASKDGPIVPLIAETSGQNVLIVDSSALPEQVIDDVIASAFQSAGQSCSALRLLCLPTATADKIIDLLKGAMDELVVGDPSKLSTDIGPVIDETAQSKLLSHVMRLEKDAKLIKRLELDETCVNGTFVAPQVWEIPRVSWLKEEAFGPILHVVRYETDELDALIDEINATEFGLIGGVHSRIESTMEHIEKRLRVGNFYSNRPLVDSSVGVRPFGGVGNSGTGPKAGGPRYLLRFATERVVSTNFLNATGPLNLLTIASNS